MTAGVKRPRSDEAQRLINAIDIAQHIGQYVALKSEGRLFKGLCPFHHDTDPSFFVDPDHDDPKWHCYGKCGTGGDVISFEARRLGISNREAFKQLHAQYLPRDLTVKHRTPEHSERTARASRTEKRSERCSGVQAEGHGLTLSELADAKQLPVEYLRAQGVSDYQHPAYGPCVRIPYLDQDGRTTHNTRLRLSLKQEPRFKWVIGAKTMLYGLESLSRIRREGWALLVEGESDRWTADYLGIPCLGVPGKTNWRREYASLFEGITLYVWVEPDADDLAQRVVDSLPSCMVVPAPDGIKDISQAHCEGLDVAALVNDLKAAATPGTLLLQRERERRLRDAYEVARPVFDAKDPLALVEASLRANRYGGDLRTPLIVYCAMTSRVLHLEAGHLPVHLLLMSASSSGKNFAVKAAMKHLPQEAVYEVDASSPRTLIYSAEPLQHRVLMYSEADSLPAGEDNPVASAIRAMLVEHRLRYEVTVKGEDDRYTVQRIDKPGPTVMVTTSTKPLGPQLMTRLFLLEVPSDQSQIAAALDSMAEQELEGVGPGPDPALIAYQAYLQARAPWDVVVPFVRVLAEEVKRSPLAPRIQRDFSRLLSFVKVVAILRHSHRSVDLRGRLVADLDDYSFVYNLVGDMYAATVTEGASTAVRKVVAAVEELKYESSDDAFRGISATQVAKRLDLSKAAVTPKVATALDGGWLVNLDPHPGRGRPLRLDLGDPLPSTVGLPDPGLVAEVFRCQPTVQQGAEQLPKGDYECEEPECSGVQAHTVGSSDGNGMSELDYPERSFEKEV